MQSLQTLIFRCCLIASAAALGACGLTTPGTDDPGHTSLRLERQDDGTYQQCDEDGTCQSLPGDPSTADCAILEIRIDLATGETCQSCYGADGDLLSQTCDGAIISCTWVTVPEPDCLVCAYVNGAIIYSTCTTDPGPGCAATTCQAGYHCEEQEVQCIRAPCPPQTICVPNEETRCETDSDCGPGELCAIEACTEMACADDRPDCNTCFGHCQPYEPNPCALVDCAPGYVCQVEDIVCITWPCDPQAVCVPVGPFDCDMSHAACDALPPECPEGYSPTILGACYGACVPSDLCAGASCNDDSQCKPGELCQLNCLPCAGEEDADGDGIIDECGCAGTCVPYEPNPCAAVDCMPGFTCEVQEIVCITEPCDPQAVCVPVGPFDCDPNGVFCDSLPPECADGEKPSVSGHCWGPCVPAALCAGPGCQDDSECAQGEWCALMCPMCTADTPPELCTCSGTCVPLQIDPCAAVDCAPGYHCEAQEIQCFTLPCDPIATCVPDSCQTDSDCNAGRCVIDGCTEMACPDGSNDCNTCFGHCESGGTRECSRTGCSGQLCSDQDIATTCEWREEYACFDTAICERRADGACGWRETAELSACIEAGGPQH